MKTSKMLLAATAFLLGLSFSAQAMPTVVVVGNNPGGQVIEFAKRALIYKSIGAYMYFNGECDSACTLYLQVPNKCIAPGASFGFHRAYDARSLKSSEIATRFMYDKYPSWVRVWINNNGGLSKNIKRMDYEYARRYMKGC